MRRKLLAMMLVTMLLAGAAVGFYLVFVAGPRMVIQPHIRTYQAEMPALDAAVVVQEPQALAPSAATADRLINPLDDSPAIVAAGKVYYQYYCLFCHGASGNGDGPVGASYVPRPADLRDAKFADYSDGRLLRAMLVGQGHSPALERVVNPRHRWPLVRYVQTLARAPATQPADQP